LQETQIFDFGIRTERNLFGSLAVFGRDYKNYEYTANELWCAVIKRTIKKAIPVTGLGRQ
jgi:hypothetical protein